MKRRRVYDWETECPELIDPGGHVRHIQRKETDMPRMTDHELATLRHLCETPAEYGTADWEAARSALANSVPDLLDYIDECRAALRESAQLMRDLRDAVDAVDVP
jgi:hypothetical protein